MSRTGPVRPNRSGEATASDRVMTPSAIAKAVVEHFKPSGTMLEPAKGSGSFLQFLPGADWCEITEGRDFFDYTGRVDWILTNPPYSIYDKFLEKCFEVADNVVLLVPLQKAFKSLKNQDLVDSYGGLYEIAIIGGGAKCGFAFGFLTGCLYYKRGYSGPINRTRISV